jgi:hypothetical protein
LGKTFGFGGFIWLYDTNTTKSLISGHVRCMVEYFELCFQTIKSHKAFQRMERPRHEHYITLHFSKMSHVISSPWAGTCFRNSPLRGQRSIIGRLEVYFETNEWMNEWVQKRSAVKKQGNRVVALHQSAPPQKPRKPIKKKDKNPLERVHYIYSTVPKSSLACDCVFGRLLTRS